MEEPQERLDNRVVTAGEELLVELILGVDDLRRQ